MCSVSRVSLQPCSQACSLENLFKFMMVSPRLQVLRRILKELKVLSPVKEPITSSLEGQYLISEYRHFSQAGETLAHKLYCDCLYYLCLLKSQRMTQLLHIKYKGAGERTVEEVAGLVGFKLPKLYQEPSDNKSEK